MANTDDTDSLPGALLSKKQRAWLKDGAPDPTSSKARQYRRRIPPRIEQSFRDMALVYEYLDDDEIREIFDLEGFAADPPTEPPIHLSDGMIAAVALCFKSYYVNEDGADPRRNIEHLIGGALRWVLSDRGEQIEEFEFDYKTDTADPEELAERLFAGEDLTYGEFETLRQHGGWFAGEGEADLAGLVSVQIRDDVGSNESD